MTVANVNKIDVKALQGLYTRNPAAKAAFDYFAGRERNSAKTGVGRLRNLIRREGMEVSRSDIIELFRALDDAGCGEFKVGRKGHKSRFEWSAALISVGQAAAGETDSVEALTEAEAHETGEDDAELEFIDHKFRLRADLEITVALPPDLSSTEAGRIADFVRTLPF